MAVMACFPRQPKSLIKKIISVLLFQSLLFAPSMVKAYGLEGHLSILNIALNQLSVEKRAKITPLLSDMSFGFNLCFLNASKTSARFQYRSNL
jgi:hypothetical protein